MVDRLSGKGQRTSAASPLIGRTDELLAASELLDSLSVGPATLLLAGEPGIGKTRLLAAGLNRARDRGAHVLLARAASSEMQLSFAGLRDLLGDAEAFLPELPPPQRRALSAALVLEEHDGPPPDPLAVGVATLRYLRALAASDPVVLAIDDLQWLDAPSGRAVEFALRRLGDERVGLFATVRAPASARLPLEVDRCVAPERCRKLTLGPLSLGAVYELLRTRLGLSLPRPLLAKVHDAARGNPFFALELGRALALQGGHFDPVGDLPVPADVDVLLSERMGKLPSPTREALLVAALAAEPTLELVSAVTGGDASATVAEAVEANLVQLEDGRVRFTHPLFSAAAAAVADPGRRREVHGRIAHLVADPEERARHLARAARGPDPAAARTIELAAELARRRGAPEVEAELFERASRLWSPKAEDERARLTIAAAAAHVRAGDAGRATTLLAELVPRLAPGPLRAEALLGLGQAEVDSANTQEWLAAALTDARGEPRLTSAIQVGLATWAELTAGIRTARRHARKAVQLAKESGDDGLLLNALAVAGHLETLAGGEKWLPMLRRAQELERRGYTTTAWLAPGHWIAVRLMWADELDPARELLEGEYRQALDENDVQSRSGLCFHLAQLETRAGNAARAQAYADEGWRLAEPPGQGQSRAVSLYAKALVEANYGDVADARSFAEEALATFEDLGDLFFTIHTRSALAQLALSLGDYAGAAAALAPARALREATEVGEPGIFPFDEASRLTSELERRGRELDRPRLLATGARCRSLLLAAQGDLDEAIAALEVALGEHDRLPVPLERGRTLLALGSIRRRLRQKRAARETLEVARSIFETVRASRWAKRARIELGRIGGRTAPRFGELSATEARIAELVAGGRTNREIAAELSLSPRTVQWNLSKVYRKLDVRSRTELAATLLQPPP